MSDRNSLLSSIALSVTDYRAGEIAAPTPQHVDRWVKQFDAEVQVPILHELDHTFKNSYLTKKEAAEFLSNLVTNEKLAGHEPCTFWRNANFLKIQQHGESQKAFLQIFGECLMKQCSLDINKCGNPAGPYIYLDDIVFSGNRIKNDLTGWIAKNAPTNATVHIIVVAVHTGGEYYVRTSLEKVSSEAKKNISLKIWKAAEFENRKSEKDNSEVLWPSVLPADALLAAYLAEPTRFPFQTRRPGGKLGPFSSESGRQLLESELLLAGVQIRAACKNPKAIVRPLGFSPFGLGFGSMFITFRNCPNNCPLAIWWGDPTAPSSSPLSKWYPLLPRKTYDL